MKAVTSGEDTPCARLAAAQLEAYNAADLEGFLACYAEDAVVLDEAGAVTMQGREQMRERYGRLFSGFREIHANVEIRIAMGRHCIDHERWSRVSLETGERSEGEILVRYTQRAGLIAIAQFLC